MKSAYEMGYYLCEVQYACGNRGFRPGSSVKHTAFLLVMGYMALRTGLLPGDEWTKLKHGTPLLCNEEGWIPFSPLCAEERNRMYGFRLPGVGDETKMAYICGVMWWFLELRLI
uniref:Uncharacterized protein n=1 Tax=Anguilla anguilla TaxID=7936 RepID=A0A0E9Y2M4_ANGAN